MSKTRNDRPAIALEVIEEEIVAKLAETMRAYVVAAREEQDDAWQEKDHAEGGANALYDLTRRAGLGDLLDIDAARERASRRLREQTDRLMAEAPATIERLEAGCANGRRDATRKEFLAYAEAQEALKYGPYIVRYLDGEDVEEIA